MSSTEPVTYSLHRGSCTMEADGIFSLSDTNGQPIDTANDGSALCAPPSSLVSTFGGTIMKLNFKAGFAVLLGIVTARLIVYFAGWSFYSSSEPFDVWNLAVEMGLPATAAMLWFWILQSAFKSPSK